MKPTSGKYKPGQDHPNAKFTEEQVMDIRRRRAVGRELLKVIAYDYSVSEPTIHRIVRGKRYPNLPLYPQDKLYHRVNQEKIND